MPPCIYFLSPWEVVDVCEAGFAKVQPNRALNPYTLTSLGICKENREREYCYDTTDMNLNMNSKVTDITINVEIQQK